jgi:nucleoside-diphosphate-sugar epimerase
MILESGESGAWNVGRDDNACPMRSVAEMACDLVAAPHSLIQEVDAPSRQTVVKRLSTAKLRSLGWKPEVELPEGMRRTLEELQSLDEKAA